MTKTEDIYQIYLDHPLITVDSRESKKDALFFALKGEHSDGNAYALDALNKGCAFAIVDDPDLFTKDDSRLVPVENVLETLQDLARYHRQHLKIPVFAVTGTNGKTTTKELIARVLSKKYRVWATMGNRNNHIGVPLTVLTADRETEIMVVEMGANHAGEIAALCEIARPTAGLITNIGTAHLEGFGSVENIIRAKNELFQFLRSVGGTLFYNQDNTILRSLISKEDKTVSYGTQENPDFKFIPPGDNPQLAFTWSSDSGNVLIQTNIYGRYNFENVMAAISVGSHYNVPEKQIIEAVVSYVPDNARSQVIDTGKNRVILDAYNANPTSVEIAIKEFFIVGGRPKAIILGDMLELGHGAKAEHLKIFHLLTSAGINDVKIFLVGHNFYNFAENSPFIHFPDTSSAQKYFNKNPLRGFTILMKGSRLMALESLLPHF